MLGPIGRLGIRNSLRAARETVRGGGPKGLRLLDVHPPEGLIAPTVTVDLEIPLRDGNSTQLSPGIPLPPPAAWAWRIGRAGMAVRDRFWSR
jgi:hypothetical protein